jgi:hypothetical protein
MRAGRARNVAGAILACLVAAALAACTMAPTGAARREAVARRIADDAIAFNEAYGQAVAGQILLNILRARDRLPRHYLTMTGINDSPSLRVRESLGAGSIPLGEGASPWGFGSFGVERETQSRPTYAIQPFSADTLTRTAFQPIAPYVFAHYWESGWPRDLLLLLVVERLTIAGPDGRAASFVNEANNIFADCGPATQTTGCDFVRELRALLTEIEASPPAPFAADGAPVCGLIEAHAPSRPVRAESGACPPRFVLGARTVTLHLRSLDDAVYYVGELMRAGSMDAGAGPIEAQITVRAAGLRGGGRGVPLFRISPEPEDGARVYAASVSYGGRRYFAGPAIGRSCADASNDGVCADNASRGDRSSSVLTLLAELMALNQSPDAIRAPSRFFAE